MGRLRVLSRHDGTTLVTRARHVQLRRSFVAALPILATLLAATTGCIPVHQVEPASPNIYGTFVDDSARPVAGAEVAIAGGAWDHPCSNSSYHGTTDSAGIFRLHATTLVRRWDLLFPAMERWGNGYGLCVPLVAGGLPTTVAYAGVAYFSRQFRTHVDTLSCLRFTADGRPHVLCRSTEDAPMQSGGHWADGVSEGTFRLIIDPSHDSPGVYLEWLDRHGVARSTRSFDFPPGKHPTIVIATLFPNAMRAPCLHVRTENLPHWYDWSRAALDSTFELGPPGVMHPVRACGAP